MSLVLKIRQQQKLPIHEQSIKKSFSQVELLMYAMASSLILNVVKQQVLHMPVLPPRLKERIEHRKEIFDKVTTPYLFANVLSYLPFNSLLSVSQVSKRLREVSQEVCYEQRQQIFKYFPMCFTLSFSRRILNVEPSLDRSTELYNFSFNSPLIHSIEPRKLSLIPSTPALIEQIKRSGSSYAFSPVISKRIGICTMEELRDVISTFPDEWRSEINGLDLKGFDLKQEKWIDHLIEIISLCPSLLKVQFYSEDMPDSHHIDELDTLNQQCDPVKIRISLT
jgi:hypothetical protein